MTAAEQTFRLDRPVKDGVTKRAMLLQLQKTTGRHLEDLDVEPIPEEVAHVFQWFTECASRNADRSEITYAEIQAYCALTGTVMWPEEVRLIRALDQAFLRVMHEASGKES